MHEPLPQMGHGLAARPRRGRLEVVCSHAHLEQRPSDGRRDPRRVRAVSGVKLSTCVRNSRSLRRRRCAR